MGLFSKKKQKSPDKAILERIDGKPLAYAVERINGEEKVIGKAGGIVVLDNAVVIMCEAHEVFRCPIEGAFVAELLSGNGCEITGVDSQTGIKRYVTAHYSYYRK